jgi:Ser/Thr protein kinase RdoA (MazF antagonist)
VIARDTPYANLTPEVVLAAIERLGRPTDGRVLALGSYENRVYQVGIEGAEPVVVKFYRPNRWSVEAIVEEHEFGHELASADIPVVAPERLDGATLLDYHGFRYAVYPRRGGRWPELATADDRVLMGRFLGRLHRVGGTRRFQHRAALSVDAMVRSSAEIISAGEWLPDYLRARYAESAQAIAEQAQAAFSAVAPRYLRVHGDCHRGNVLWTETGPHFVDLDDCAMGPAVQDLWMLLAGSRAEMTAQCRDLLEGYEQFNEFDRGELALIEPLRAMRMVHYAAWLARRWSDPAFPRAFPWFGGARYWENHVIELGQQLEALAEPALRP